MDKDLLHQILLFLFLILIAFVALVYYFYKAAYRFDPYYKQQTYQADLIKPN